MDTTTKDLPMVSLRKGDRYWVINDANDAWKLVDYDEDSITITHRKHGEVTIEHPDEAMIFERMDDGTTQSRALSFNAEPVDPYEGFRCREDGDLFATMEDAMVEAGFNANLVWSVNYVDTVNGEAVEFSPPAPDADGYVIGESHNYTISKVVLL